MSLSGLKIWSFQGWRSIYGVSDGLINASRSDVKSSVTYWFQVDIASHVGLVLLVHVDVSCRVCVSCFHWPSRSHHLHANMKVDNAYTHLDTATLHPSSIRLSNPSNLPLFSACSIDHHPESLTSNTYTWDKHASPGTRPGRLHTTPRTIIIIISVDY